MNAKRDPWLIPVALVVLAAMLYFAVIFTRGGLDRAELAGSWLTYFVVFVTFAAIAVVAYRSLRRSRAIPDEARSKYHR
jgi:hypothetical protein